MPLSGVGSPMGFGSLLPQIRAILEQQAATNPLLQQTVGRLAVDSPIWAQLAAGVAPGTLPFDPGVGMSAEEMGRAFAAGAGFDPRGRMSVVDTLLARGGVGGAVTGIADADSRPHYEQYPGGSPDVRAASWTEPAGVNVAPATSGEPGAMATGVASSVRPPVAMTTGNSAGAARSGPSSGSGKRYIPPWVRKTVTGLGYPVGIGEYAYLSEPEALYEAMKRIENNPVNEGLLVGPNAAKPGDTDAIRHRKRADTVKYAYERWISAGKPGDFLDYLAYGGPGYDGWAPLGADNDPPRPKHPYGLNPYWLRNLLWWLPRSVKTGAVYGTPRAVEAQRAIAEARVQQRPPAPPPMNYRGR